jgi:hypothetical protein
MTDWNEDFTDGGIDEGPDENDADLLDEDRIELVPCPHCGAMISEYAQQCPTCGDWIISGDSESPLSGKRPLWWIILAVAGIIMFVIIYAFF